jgi:hypothetical protein
MIDTDFIALCHVWEIEEYLTDVLVSPQKITHINERPIDEVRAEYSYNGPIEISFDWTE